MSNPLSLIVLRGLPASGKSTWAAAYVAASRRRGRMAGVVSRDAVREHVLGLTMLPGDQMLDRAGEDLVTVVVDAQARALLANDCDVVVDATHLVPAHVDRWRTLAAWYGAGVEVVDMGVPAEECVARDAARAAAGGRGVGAEVIRRMAASGRPTYETGA